MEAINELKKIKGQGIEEGGHICEKWACVTKLSFDHTVGGIKYQY